MCVVSDVTSVRSAVFWPWQRAAIVLLLVYCFVDNTLLDVSPDYVVEMCHVATVVMETQLVLSQFSNFFLPYLIENWIRFIRTLNCFTANCKSNMDCVVYWFANVRRCIFSGALLCTDTRRHCDARGSWRWLVGRWLNGLTLKLVCKSHQRWGTFLLNSGTLGLWVPELFAMYATDGRTKATLIAPFPTGVGIIIWSWYTGRWWVGCYIWYSEEGLGGLRPRPMPSSLYQM